MEKPDYGLKSEVLASGLVQKYKDIQKAKYAYYAMITTGLIVKNKYGDNISGALNDERLFSSQDPVAWREAERISNADYHRQKRLQVRIRSMLKSEIGCTFCTLTFTDDVLQNTSPDTRRQYVRRFLKDQLGEERRYVANIDFGKVNGREHYHAVIEGRLDPVAWKYGALNVKAVCKTSEPKALAKYVAKLSNHAIKETCKRSVLIYSRQFNSFKMPEETETEKLCRENGFHNLWGAELPIEWLD